MGRQKTKVAEWWERRPDPANHRICSAYKTKSGACSDDAKKRGTLHHVTRYRLAPLVRLRWVQSLADLFLDATDGNVCRASVRPDGGEWCVRVWHDDHPVYAATLAEAKAACAARLRELGYRVVDE